ncbi:unnamed protein product, partial [Arctogadus glacialis]
TTAHQTQPSIRPPTALTDPPPLHQSHRPPGTIATPTKPPAIDRTISKHTPPPQPRQNISNRFMVMKDQPPQHTTSTY